MKQERRRKITNKYVCKNWNKVTEIKCNVSFVQSVIRLLTTLIIHLSRNHSLPKPRMIDHDHQFHLKNCA